MPPARRNNDDDDLTVSQVEAAGRLLMPHFREAIRDEMRGPMDALDQRVTMLESTSNKVKLVYGVIAAGVGWILLASGEWAKKKLGL